MPLRMAPPEKERVHRQIAEKVKLPAHRAGPFDRTHGSELVEELPGHAVASRMRAKEVSFILCPLAGHIPVNDEIPRGNPNL